MSNYKITMRSLTYMCTCFGSITVPKSSFFIPPLTSLLFIRMPTYPYSLLPFSQFYLHPLFLLSPCFTFVAVTTRPSSNLKFFGTTVSPKKPTSISYSSLSLYLFLFVCESCVGDCRMERKKPIIKNIV